MNYAELPGILLTPRYDIASLLRAVGKLSGSRALDVSPTEREAPQDPVDLLEDRPSLVSGRGDVAGFVDGVQSAIVLTYRDRRPVYLSHTAAGVMSLKCGPVASMEAVTLIASATDEQWIAELGTDIPRELLSSELPPDLERDAHRLLAMMRDKVERGIVEDALKEHLAVTDRPLVLDGSLQGRPQDSRLVGVVKTVRTQYLEDERVLYSLQAGWRSPMFRIPGRGESKDRYSSYLRLHDREQAAWSFGIVRLETYLPEQIDNLARVAMSVRQPIGARDARADRHLAPVRACEEFLRSRRPGLFDASR